MNLYSGKARLPMTSEFGHAMRSAELTLAIPLLPSSGRVLELGAGDGWQASLLARHGFLVTPVDVASAAMGTGPFVPVTIYDGRTLPFPDGSFDAVYSSNVLEHVKDFDRIQAELARVLTNNGFAVHCVPTATWRFWTTIGHPFHALRWVWNSRRHATDPANHSQARRLTEQYENKGVLGLLHLGLIAPRHGEHGNLLSEHHLFRRRSWKRRFIRTGWTIDSVHSTGLFYSGNELLALHLTRRVREGLAKLLGSSTCIFVVRPRTPRP